MIDRRRGLKEDRRSKSNHSIPKGRSIQQVKVTIRVKRRTLPSLTPPQDSSDFTSLWFSKNCRPGVASVVLFAGPSLSFFSLGFRGMPIHQIETHGRWYCSRHDTRLTKTILRVWSASHLAPLGHELSFVSNPQACGHFGLNHHTMYSFVSPAASASGGTWVRATIVAASHSYLSPVARCALNLRPGAEGSSILS